MIIENARIRFNLAKGKTFMKWKVEDDSNVLYLDPDKWSLIMRGCVLHNNRKKAEEIFNGANKDVCSWIDVSELEICPSELCNVEIGDSLYYNPRVNPYWYNSNGDIMDFMSLSTIQSMGKELNYKEW
jgi:hypothetical protein